MPVARPSNLKIGGVDLAPPIYFPSVSSIKTALPLLDYIRSLVALGNINGQFLVSAFDYAKASAVEQDEFKALLAHANGAGTTVLVDSGNYESYWNRGCDVWSQADFHRALRDLACPLAFGFDEQEPPGNFDSHVRVILERQEQDRAVADLTTIIPIVHGKPEILPALCAVVARGTGVTMLAVPERGLGNGVFERARTIVAIRQVLDAEGRYVGLHLLGTGNPISLALYSIAGADSFDGLEWCQTVVDHETALLFHFSQADFFARQTRWCDEDLSFHAKALAHNLEFYADWMRRLRQALHGGEGVQFCKANFPHRIFGHCAAAMGWEV